MEFNTYIISVNDMPNSLPVPEEHYICMDDPKGSSFMVRKVSSVLSPYFYDSIKNQFISHTKDDIFRIGENLIMQKLNDKKLPDWYSNMHSLSVDIDDPAIRNKSKNSDIMSHVNVIMFDHDMYAIIDDAEYVSNILHTDLPITITCCKKISTWGE